MRSAQDLFPTYTRTESRRYRDIPSSAPSQRLTDSAARPAETVLEDALETAGGLTIPQPDQEGKTSIPVGKIIISDQGVAFKKPLVQGEGFGRTTTDPVQ